MIWRHDRGVDDVPDFRGIVEQRTFVITAYGESHESHRKRTRPSEPAA